MGRLDAALARFHKALETLESRVSERLETVHRSDLNGDSGALRDERDRLLSRIATLEEESSALADITEAVETRLDGAIAEIRSVLSRD